MVRSRASCTRVSAARSGRTSGRSSSVGIAAVYLVRRRRDSVQELAVCCLARRRAAIHSG
jgi:hypothetical protein